MSLFKKRRNLIVKSNDLVQARYKLTSVEQKLILAMVACIEPEDDDFKTYNFRVTELAEFIGINHKEIYSEISQVANRLRKRDVNIYDSESKSFINTGWLSSIRYFMGAGSVDLRFDPYLKPYLLNLKARFIKYKPEVIKNLNSGYSIRIYELLKQYQKIGKRLFDIGELRAILGINKSEYKRYFDFKKRVLDPAKQDLNNYTDIEIHFKEIRRGKAVEAIEYYIVSNNQSKNKIEEIGVAQVPATRDIKLVLGVQNELRILFTKLVDYLLLSKAQANEVIAKFPKEYLLDQINNIGKDYENKEIRNKGAYAYKAIIDGYQYRKSLFEVEREEDRRNKTIRKEELQKSRERFVMELSHKTKRIEQGLSTTEKEVLLTEFEKEKVNRVNRKSWKESGLESPLIRATWEKFLQEKFLDTDEMLFKGDKEALIPDEGQASSAQLVIRWP